MPVKGTRQHIDTVARRTGRPQVDQQSGHEPADRRQEQDSPVKAKEAGGVDLGISTDQPIRAEVDRPVQQHGRDPGHDAHDDGEPDAPPPPSGRAVPLIPDLRHP
jgi:hypothetical protein